MRGLDEILKIFWMAIRCVGREWQHTVVSPISPAGKIAHRHQFQCSDADVGEIIQPFCHSSKRSGWTEGSNVEFVDDGVLPGSTLPAIILPVKSTGVDNFAGAVHVSRLKARRRVWHAMLAIDPKI